MKTATEKHLKADQTIKDKINLIGFINTNIGAGVLFLITIFSLIRCLKIGRYFLLMSSLATLILSVANLNAEFSKFNILLLFVYLVISYYIYEFYIFDQKESFKGQRGLNTLFRVGQN